MLRRLPFLILGVALLVAVEPLVHSHPLWENSDARSAASNSACAVCAAGVTQLPTTAPPLFAPLVVVSELAPQPIARVCASVALAIPSRAPPAA